MDATLQLRVSLQREILTKIKIFNTNNLFSHHIGMLRKIYLQMSNSNSLNQTG